LRGRRCGRRCNIGQLRRRNLCGQRKGGQEPGGQQNPGKTRPIKFVTFLPKYVTKEDNLLDEVSKGRFVRGSYGTRLQAKTVAWMSGVSQPELFGTRCFDGMPILPIRER
jgi:hypothetical protein